MENLEAVNAINDIDQDVHYRGPGNSVSTLCGMKIAELAPKGDVTCYRCHQFAIGAF